MITEKDNTNRPSSPGTKKRRRRRSADEIIKSRQQAKSNDTTTTTPSVPANHRLEPRPWNPLERLETLNKVATQLYSHVATSRRTAPTPAAQAAPVPMMVGEAGGAIREAGSPQTAGGPAGMAGMAGGTAQAEVYDQSELSDMGIEELRAAFESANSAYRQQRQHLRSEERTLRVKNQELANLDKSIKAEEAELEERRNTLMEAKRRIETCSSLDLDGIETEKAQAEREAKSHNIKLDTLKMDYERNADERAKLKGSTRDTENLRESVDADRRKLKQKQRHVIDFERELERSKDEINNVDQTVTADQSRIKSEKKELSQALDQLKLDVAKENKKYQDFRDTDDEDHSNLVDQAKRVARDNEEIHKEISNLLQMRQQLMNRKNQYNAMRERMEALQAERGEIEREMSRIKTGPQGAALKRATHDAGRQATDVDNTRKQVLSQAKKAEAESKKMKQLIAKVTQEKVTIVEYQKKLAEVLAAQQDIKNKIEDIDEKLDQASEFDPNSYKREIIIETEDLRKRKNEVLKLQGQLQATRDQSERLEGNLHGRSKAISKQQEAKEQELVENDTKLSIDQGLFDDDKAEVETGMKLIEGQEEKVDDRINELKKAWGELENREDVIEEEVRQIEDKKLEIQYESADVNMNLDSAQIEYDDVKERKRELQESNDITDDQWAAFNQRQQENKQRNEEREQSITSQRQEYEKHKTEETWWQTINVQIEQLSKAKQQYAANKQAMEQVADELEEQENSLEREKGNLLKMKRNVEDAGRGLAALKYDVHKQAQALKRSRQATDKVRAGLKQDVAEHVKYRQAKADMESKKRLLNKDKQARDQLHLELERARDSQNHEASMVLKREDELAKLIREKEAHKMQVKKIEDQYEQLKLQVESEKLESEQFVAEVDKLEDMVAEMQRVNKQKAIDNAAEKARIEQEQKEEDMANIEKERNNLADIQDTRQKAIDRRDRMLKELEALRKKREVILQAQAKIAREEVDVKRRRKQQVNALTITTQMNNEFNGKIIHEFGDPDVIDGVKTRQLIEEQREEVLRLLKIVLKLRNNLIKQNKVVVELRAKCDDRRHLAAMMEQRLDIAASRKVLQSQRRKVIESKKKLREIIQNIVIEKRQNERQFREMEESREDRESLELQLGFDKQTYDNNMSAQLEMSNDTLDKEELLGQRSNRLDADKGKLEEERERLKESTTLVEKLCTFLSEDRDGAKGNIVTMRDTVQKLTGKIQQALTPGGEQQPEPDENQPCFIVSNAGSGKEVDGIYCRAKNPELTEPGAIEFYMKNMMGLFVMVFEPDEGGTWWISRRDIEFDDDFYYVEGEHGAPPEHGWKINLDEDTGKAVGMDPPPRITTHEKYVPAEGMGIEKEEKTEAELEKERIRNMLDFGSDDDDDDIEESSEKPLIDPTLPLIEQTRLRREMLDERVKSELSEVDTAMEVVRKQTEFNQDDAHKLNDQLADFRTKFMDAVKAKQDFECKIDELEEKCDAFEKEYVILKKRRTCMMMKKLVDKARRSRERKIKQAQREAEAEKQTTVVDQEGDDDLEDDLLDLMFHHSADPTIELAYHMGPYFDRYRTDKEKHLSYKLNFAGVVYSFLEGVSGDIRGAAKDLIGFGINAFQEIEKKKIAGNLLITGAADPTELRRKADIAEKAGNMEEANRLREEAKQADEAKETAAAFDKFKLGDDFDEDEAENFNLDEEGAIEEKSFDQIMGLIAFQRAKQKEKEADIAADIAEYSLDDTGVQEIVQEAVEEDSDDMDEFADLLDW